MELLETQVFRGPSVYSLNPVIRMRLDMGRWRRGPRTSSKALQTG